MIKKNLVFLTGFMASGKSTIGPILANTIGWNFCDLDKLIEKHSGKSIKKIFEENGEKYFRELEKKTLQEVLNFKDYIIALGGGTITDKDNLELIKSSGFLIYLETSAEEAYRRLKFKRDRPVLLFEDSVELSKTEFIKKINELFEKRKKYYNQADIKINTDDIHVGRTVDKLASIIIKEMEIENYKN